MISKSNANSHFFLVVNTLIKNVLQLVENNLTCYCPVSSSAGSILTFVFVPFNRINSEETVKESFFRSSYR